MVQIEMFFGKNVDHYQCWQIPPCRLAQLRRADTAGLVTDDRFALLNTSTAMTVRTR